MNQLKRLIWESDYTGCVEDSLAVLQQWIVAQVRKLFQSLCAFQVKLEIS